ncbi:MAG: 16S rRNA (guanine(966)-N(2))-methyltransferase RsmD [Clostridium sp.]
MRIIAGKARGRKILSPEGMVTRPTLDRVKESMFNIIQNRTPNAVVADMFSGTGSLGLEAASRGAKKCYLMDKADDTFLCLQENVKNLNFGDICTCHKGDCYEWMQKFSKDGVIFDIIFIDPPYAKEMIPPAIKIISKHNLLQRDGIIVCKIDSAENIFQGNEDIVLVSQRKYGNTTVLFYEYK